MQASGARSSSRAALISGVTAGLIGGVTIDAFLIALRTGIEHQPVLSLWTYIASAALGTNAFSMPAAPLLGFLMHFAISAGWGAGYAYLLPQTPQLLRHPLISGSVYGLIVYIMMQLLLLANGMAQPINQLTLAIGLIAHIVFFGIPVALIAPRLTQRVI